MPNVFTVIVRIFTKHYHNSIDKGKKIYIIHTIQLFPLNQVQLSYNYGHTTIRINNNMMNPLARAVPVTLQFNK